MKWYKVSTIFFEVHRHKRLCGDPIRDTSTSYIHLQTHMYLLHDSIFINKYKYIYMVG